jgi:formate transporter
MEQRENHFADSLLPNEMALRAEEIGAKKVALSFSALFALSVLAGAFIAFGGLLSTTVAAGVSGVLPYGVARLLIGFVFSLGLILVVIGGAELFTGNNLIVMAWANKRVTTRQILRNWLIVYLGNFVGAAGIAVLVFFSGQNLFGNASIGISALTIAESKSSLGFMQAIILGILCNVLVCLAVWMSFSGRTVTDKVIAVFPPVTAFVACGFEHSVANMYFIPLGLLLKFLSGPEFWLATGKSAADFPNIGFESFLFGNLLPVTIGNIIGGAFLVGIVYWFVYLRSRKC